MEKLNTTEIKESLKQLRGWNYENGTIWKSYTFKDFKEAFSVMTRIAFECEKLNHHPNWENVYNSLTVHLNTHDVGGITKNDFDLAKSIERIVGKKIS
ncbi:MAG: 4a-hydroxytetrahydrobiopterin dehydratase [Flavobacteriaceae bacterium]